MGDRPEGCIERGCEMTRWKVWFSQVNQVVLEVDAASEAEAIVKAEKEWKRSFGYPEVIEVERSD